MHHHYIDIRSRIPEPPLWFDENAVPRYDAFRPRDVADIYAKEVALVLIACQNCKQEFKVAFSYNAMDEVRAIAGGHKRISLADSIRRGWIHYGDPPNVECCGAGPTMNSDPICVLEYWHKDNAFEWQRDQNLEIAIHE